MRYLRSEERGGGCQGESRLCGSCMLCTPILAMETVLQNPKCRRFYTVADASSLQWPREQARVGVHPLMKVAARRHPEDQRKLKHRRHLTMSFKLEVGTSSRPGVHHPLNSVGLAHSHSCRRHYGNSCTHSHPVRTMNRESMTAPALCLPSPFSLRPSSFHSTGARTYVSIA